MKSILTTKTKFSLVILVTTAALLLFSTNVWLTTIGIPNAGYRFLKLINHILPLREMSPLRRFRLTKQKERISKVIGHHVIALFSSSSIYNGTQEPAYRCNQSNQSNACCNFCQSKSILTSFIAC